MLLKKPELTDFDPTNKEHRAAVKAFMRRSAWSDSPIRFKHDAKYSAASVADQVQSKLLNWYLAKEKYTFPTDNTPRIFIGTIQNQEVVRVA